jgi:hypothetical protein
LLDCGLNSNSLAFPLGNFGIQGVLIKSDTDFIIGYGLISHPHRDFPPQSTIRWLMMGGCEAGHHGGLDRLDGEKEGAGSREGGQGTRDTPVKGTTPVTDFLIAHSV